MKLPKLLFSLAICLTALSAQAAINLKEVNRPSADLVRDVTSKPVEMLALMDIKPGATVLDLLGGSGYYSELLSQQVGPTGKVILHNNKAYVNYIGKDLDARLATGHLKNVQRYDREASQLELAENSLDAVVFVMGYHDMYHVTKDWKVDPTDTMRQIRKALKPNGLMLVIDHNAPAGSKTAAAQENHRIDAVYVKDELAKFGFETVAESDLLQNPKDGRDKSVFDPSVRGRTDRFVLVVKNKK